MRKRSFKVFIGFSLLIAAGFGLWLYLQNSQPKPISTVQNPAQTPAVTLPAIPDAPAWPFWGGATNSASVDGTAFFDRPKGRAFLASVDLRLQPYVVELRARSFLPAAFDAQHASLTDIFPAPSTVEPRQAYIQFIDHPDAAQRAQLAAAGIDLLTYMGGYAWSARGMENAFAAAAGWNFVRGLARVDPRDKLHAEVFHGTTPPYSLDADGRTRFVVLALAGTTLDSFKSQLADADIRDYQPGSVSFIGPIFEIRAQPTQALAIASAASTAFIEYLPPPVAIRDATSDSTSNINQVRDQDPFLDGTGITVAVREITRPIAHVDFAARLTVIDPVDQPGTSNHSTQVTGLIASNGATVPTAKGAAPNSKVFFYSLIDGSFATNDIVDMTSRGVRFSNHSYGPVMGNDPNFSIPPFGDYRMVSADWDNAMRANNHLCFLAGYENNNPDYIREDFFVGNKNGICVSASTSSAKATPPTDGIASFSNYGPMQDGRVKPDLVAFGENVIVTTGTNSSAVNNGTSFSTPTVTGIAALVAQRFVQTSGSQPNAALMKATLIQTASDLGLPGPDAIYGFGIANARAAVDLVNLSTPTSSPFVEGTLRNGDVQKFEITVGLNQPELKATLCWMDVAGAPGGAKALVNDLDLIISDPLGNTIFPYQLNAQNPSSAATNSSFNTVDPIEQIIVKNPTPGTWIVSLIGKSIPVGPQQFAFCSNILLKREFVANAIASPVKGPAPLDVMFNASGSSGDIQSYYWDFGDAINNPATNNATGVEVSHIYTAVGAYTATLTITDVALNIKQFFIQINVEKQLKIVFPFKATGRVSIEKPSTNTLAFTVIVPELVRTAQQVRDAIKNGEFEGKNYYVRIGVAPALNEMATFLIDRKLQQKGKTESFKIDLRKGAISVSLKQNDVAPIHNLKALYNQFGITATTPSLKTFNMRIEIESDIATEDIIYRADFPMVYTGKGGKGTIKQVKQ